MLTKDNTVILACTSMLLHVEAAQKKMKTDFPVIEADREYHVDPQSMKQCLRNKLTELPDSVENVLAAMACCGGSWDGIRAERKQENADLIRCMGAHVNLIPINPVDGSPYSATDAENVRRFQAKLTALGVNATIRRRLGSEISAACGQLRRKTLAESAAHPAQ